MLKTLSKERTGEVMIITETMMYSLFPIIIAYSTRIFPPVLFAGLSIFTAGVTLFLYLLFTKNLGAVIKKDALKYSLGVTLFIIIIPAILIFTGSSKTSGINTTLLLQAEIIFTLAIYGIWKIEKITLRKIIGALVVMTGTTVIIYNGATPINIGDLLIIAGTAVYPIGNIFAKKALKVTAPSVILFIRNLLGGITLLSISFLFEDHSHTLQGMRTYWPLILLNGIFIFHLSKILWYEGIKRIDVSKAIPLSVGTYPIFGIFFAVIFLKETPTTDQILGFLIVLAGIAILIRENRKT